MSTQFDAPPAGAIPTQTERSLSVKYKANKTPKQYANMATDDTLQECVLKNSLGFGYYDKEDKRNVPMPEMQFVVLEVYAGVTGYDGDSVSFWSSRVKDTRNEEISVWASNHKEGPLLKGFYVGKRNGNAATVGGLALPTGAKYAKFVKAYCINLDRVIEIELTGASERGIQKAVAISDQKTAFWDKIFVLGLAQSDHLWGFALQGYNRTTKDGYEYKGEGDLFFEPRFHAGIVNPVKSPDLHAKCVKLQNEERALHESYKQRNAAGPTENSAPVETNIRATESENALPTTKTANPAISAGLPDEDRAPREEPDDLPF